MCTETQKEEKSSNSSSPKHDDSNILLRNVSGLIFIIWFLYLTCAPRIIPGFKCLVYWLLPHGLLYDAKGDINWGTLGDYFGALNCLFAGLAFAAVYVSIRQQSKSINIQQNELDAQLKEMKDSVEEARQQNEIQIKNQFTNEFYQRLDLLKKLESGISYEDTLGSYASTILTGHIVLIIESIIANDAKEAEMVIKEKEEIIFTTIEKFKVWSNSFILLVSDIDTHHREQVIIKTRTAKNKRLILKEAAKSIRHYRSILIESSIWGEIFLILLLNDYYDKCKQKQINKLRTHRAFIENSLLTPTKQKQYQFILKKLLVMSRGQKLAPQIQKICIEYQQFEHSSR